MTEAEKISENIRYIRPSQYEKMTGEGWMFESFPFGSGIMGKVKDRIAELMKDNKVFCGWMATSIRGYHDNYIIYKER